MVIIEEEYQLGDKMADPYRKLQKQIASLGPGTEFLESLYNDMISSGELDPNTTYEEFVAMDPLNTFDIDREQRAGGGMMDINTMTAPLGYAAGGPIPKDSGGLQPPTGLSKWYADKFPVDPIHQLKENLIDKGKRTVKGIGKGLGELFVAKPAGAEEGNLMDSIINLFMMNELTKEGIEWDDDDDLLAKYYDKFGDPFENIKIKKPGLE